MSRYIERRGGNLYSIAHFMYVCIYRVVSVCALRRRRRHRHHRSVVHCMFNRSKNVVQKIVIRLYADLVA